jgi:predicted transport protein/RecB family endonuclease NucS
MIFQIQNGKATRINTKEFKNELELHRLIDRNLNELFEIRYIKDEHITDKHGRIETLGLDNSNRPVVIEYKKTMEKGQLAQANRYAMWIKQHPAEFELLVRKNLKVEDEIDFYNSRIICFAQEYNIDDKCLAVALGAELWKYQLYENDTLVITREEEPEQLIKTSQKNVAMQKTEIIQTQKKEIRKPKTVEQHLELSSTEIKKLFEELNERILNLSTEIERYTTWQNILYKTSVIIVELNVQKNRLRLLLRTENGEIDDPKHLAQAVPETHGWGKLSHIVYVYPEQNMDDIMNLVFQSFKSTQ